MPCEMGNCVFLCDSEDFEHVCMSFCLAFSEMRITSVQWHRSMKGLQKKNWNICGKGGYGVCVCAGWREMIDGVQ